MSDGVKDKIRKLLAKSTDAGASEAEAEACARAARRLMEEHSLTEESLRERAAEPSPLAFPQKYQDPWRKALAGCVAESLGCRFMWRPRSEEFVFWGADSGTVVAHGTFKRLERIVLTLASAHRSAVRGVRQDQLRFERACGLRVAVRVAEIVKSAESGVATSGALVLVSESRRVDDWMRENVKMVKCSVGEVKVEGRSGREGWRAGGEVALGGEIGDE